MSVPWFLRTHETGWGTLEDVTHAKGREREMSPEKSNVKRLLVRHVSFLSHVASHCHVRRSSDSTYVHPAHLEGGLPGFSIKKDSEPS